MAAPLGCGNCEQFLAHYVKHLPELGHDIEGAREAAIAAARADHERRRQLADSAGSRFSDGDCRRYPTPVAKEEHDMCGEHSELVAQRQAELVAPILEALHEVAEVLRASQGAKR